MIHLVLKAAVAVTVAVAWATVGASDTSAEASQNDRPNVIVVTLDDMGWSDLGCYGGEVRTPNMDALAEGGLRFTQFYNAGRCCPTRASLLTGLYPHQAGIGQMTFDTGLPGYRGFEKHYGIIWGVVN